MAHSHAPEAPARPWLSQYPAAVPTAIDPGRYDSLSELVDACLSRFAARPAFTNRGTTLTYAEVDSLSRAFAAYLQSLPGFERGDRIAIMLPNLLQSPIAMLGVLRAGMVVVNVNPLYTPRELEHQLRDSGAKAILVLENFAAKVEAVLAQTSIVEVITTTVGDQHAAPKRLLIDFVVRHVKRLVPSWHIAGTRSFRTALARGARLDFKKPKLRRDDLAFLQYTGGTTGVAKGAELTHGNIVSNVLQVATWAEPFFDADRGAVITPLPLYHIFALTVNLFGFAALGAHDVLITDPRDLDGLISELKRSPFAFISGVNTLFNALLHAPGFEKIDFSHLQICLAGGMAVQRDVAERWRAVTGVAIAQGYGLTEASPVVTANRLDTQEFNGSVGLPLPSTDIVIRDDDEAPVPIGESGEIWVKGPQVMRGYWQRKADTADVLKDGWLRTGDVGRLDAQGYLFIEDRKKDVIVVSGFKVFPNEVEDVIMSHPGVREVAAIGVPDASSGEAVKVCVVRKDPALTEDELIAHCRKSLTGYKIPRYVEFRKELPKTNVGKVLRRALKEQDDDSASG